MIAEQLQNKVLAGIAALQEAVEEQRTAAIEKATADWCYRQAQAIAYMNVMAHADGRKPTEAHIKAIVDSQCNKEMERVRMAEALHEAAYQRLLSLRTEISALQSLMGCHKAEAELLTYSGQLTT